MALLEVDELVTKIYSGDGTLTPVNGHSFTVEEGEVVGIAGESGSGKTLTAMSIMQLVESPVEIASGEIRFKGRNLLDLSMDELQTIRGNELSMVFQDATSSLNPVYTVGFQIARVIRRHRGYDDATKKQRAYNRYAGKDIDDRAREEAIELMRKVKIPDARERYDEYPHAFSGGMRQRALIAMALACEPDLLIADEPTTGLDVTTQAEIFELLDEIQTETGMSVILITHDLAAIAETCDRVIMMYSGDIVETGTVSELFKRPFHPYTVGLMNSIPDLKSPGERLNPIEGSLPSLSDLPKGCNFHPRCPFADDKCRKGDPPLEEKARGRDAACFHTDEVRSEVRGAEVKHE